MVATCAQHTTTLAPTPVFFFLKARIALFIRVTTYVQNKYSCVQFFQKYSNTHWRNWGFKLQHFYIHKEILVGDNGKFNLWFCSTKLYRLLRITTHHYSDKKINSIGRLTDMDINLTPAKISFYFAVKHSMKQNNFTQVAQKGWTNFG